jgi:hypothetical protein
MRNEARYIKTCVFTGIVELGIWLVFKASIMSGLGIASLVFALIYSLIYKEETGESIWTQK